MIFDWIFYINRYPELYSQGINTKEKAIKHWCEIGINEKKLFNKNQININWNSLNKNKICNQLLKIEHFNNNRFIIVIDKPIESIAINLQNLLKNINIDSKIIYELSDEDEDSNDYYIIIYNPFNKSFLPKKYILYIVEQATSRFFKDNKYLNMIKNANYVWDFTTNNRNKFENYPFSKFFYLACPFTYINEYNDKNEYDIFIYGSINTRRQNIINKLREQNYNIFVSNKKIYGTERDNIIKKSKIILNLHFYEDAGLELCRLNEVLKFNKLVISELPYDDIYNIELYKKSVVFIDEIKDNSNQMVSNINNLYKELDKYLKNSTEYNKKINEIKVNNQFLKKHSEFNIQKLLLPLNLGIDYKINYELIPNKIYCLHLVETPNRIKVFNKQKYKPDVEIFPAIKYEPGWIGCALSYVNLIYNAKKYNLDKITICEDDCRFKLEGYDTFDKLYNNINDLLNKINWDIFVGCVADLPEDTTFNNIYKYKDITFIEINKMHSTVFNIYNKTCYDKIINWDFNNKNRLNQIDQYIKKQNFKIIITYPFYFDCLDVDSSLWGKNLYVEYNNMFNNSLKLIKSKLDKWDKPIIYLD